MILLALYVIVGLVIGLVLINLAGMVLTSVFNTIAEIADANYKGKK